MSIYADLDHNQIRLLSVTRPDSEAKWQHTLHEATLLDRPNVFPADARGGSHSLHASYGAQIGGYLIAYQAVSYLWNDDEESTPSSPHLATLDVLGESGESHCLTVSRTTINVLDTIKEFYFFEHMYLWIDQICINQASTAEKSVQVGGMKGIYEQAHSIFASLGQPRSDSSLALTTIEELVINTDQEDRVKRVQRFWSQTRQHHELPPNEIDVQMTKFIAIERLLHRPWFHRAWIQLETTALDADRVLLICGKTSTLLRWLRSFLIAISIASRSTSSPTLELSSWCARASNVAELNIKLANWRSARAIQITTSLPDLLNIFRLCETSDPRDKIYSVLPYACDTTNNTLAFKIDYSLNFLQVSLQFVQWFVGIHDDLEFLAYCIGTSSGKPYWPSWIPDFSCTLAHNPFQRRIGSDASLPLFYSPLGKRKPACATILASSVIEFPIIPADGIRIATVIRTMPALQLETPSENFASRCCQPLSMQDHCPLTGLTIEEVVYRSINGDVLYSDGSFMDEDESDSSDDATVIDCLLRVRQRTAKSRTRECYQCHPLLNELVDETLHGSNPPRFRTILHVRQRSEAEERASDIMIAAAASAMDIQIGDEIWALEGSSMLCVLRRSSRPTYSMTSWPEKEDENVHTTDQAQSLSSNTNKYYRYVTECFMLGLMNAEIVTYMRQDRPKPACLSQLPDCLETICLC